MKEAVLKVEDISVDIATEDGIKSAVKKAGIFLCKGEVLALVGESGCGKTMLCRSIMGLLPKAAAITGGKIMLRDMDITDLPEKKMRNIRGKEIALVFQDPLTSLDPTYSVGDQIYEAIRIHNKSLSKDEIRSKVYELMELVGIEYPRERYKLYPYNFSGGMRQRCVLAMALAHNPDVLLADEPTTALDVTVQALILDLLNEIKEKLGTAILLVSHDLGVVANIADRVAIMHQGQIVETGKSRQIFHEPGHPYTKSLLSSHPAFLSRKTREIEPFG